MPPTSGAPAPHTLTPGPAKPTHAAWRACGAENRKFHRVRGGGFLYNNTYLTTFLLAAHLLEQNLPRSMTIYIYIYAARRRRTLGCIGRQSASLLDTRHALLAICPGFKCASVPSGAWHGRGGYGAAHACRAGCRRGLGLLDFRLREGDRIDRLCNGPSKIPPCGSAGTDEVAMSVLPTFSTVTAVLNRGRARVS